MISRVMEKRGSLEDPSTSLANPAAWIVDWATGGKTAAGVNVSNATALNLSAVYAAVRRISDDVAKIPLISFERLDRGRRRATEHHLYPLLKDRPNPAMSSYSFWETYVGHWLLWGNGYAEVERDGSGRVVALWPLRPDKMTVRWVRGGTTKGYLYQRPDGERIPFMQDEIFHVPGFGFDGLVGYNPIRMARESLGLTSAMEKFGASFFGNASRPSGVLKTPEKLSDSAFERLRRSWENMHKGVQNAHRVAILEEGVAWERIGVPPGEAQFLGGRQFQTREVARWFQIAPQKIGDLDDAHFNNAEHFDQAHLSDTIQPIVERIERQANWELFPESERGTFYAKFLTTALLRPDSKARAEYLSAKFQSGAVSPNDWRELDEENPVEGGDQYFVPMNMVPLDRASDPIGSGDNGPEDDDFRGPPGRSFLDPPDPPPPPRPSGNGSARAGTATLTVRNRYGEEATIPLTAAQTRSVALRQRLVQANHELFRDTAQRVLNRELIQARRAIGRAFGGRDQQQFRVWLDEFYSDHGDFVAEQFTPVLLSYSRSVYQAAAEEVGGREEMDAEEERFVQEYADIYGRRWSDSSHGQLLAILRDTEPEEVEAALAQRLDEWEERRADKEAIRETVRASGAVTKLAFAASAITVIRWVTLGDSCPYCERMNGRTVAIEAPFLESGDSVDPEVEDKDPMTVYQTVGHPPLHRGCDCHLVAA